MSLQRLRILGYAATLVLHCSNLIVMARITKKNLSADVQLKVFRGMMYRYFTCWTVMLQILYAALGLCCDLLEIMNRKNKKYKLPKTLSFSRNVMFSALVWPCSWMVCIVFWSLFLYDRSLIFPVFIDQVLSKTSNHIIHTAIVPIVVWEALCRPRVKPKSDVRNLAQLTLHMLVYLAVFYYTHIHDGVWLYPIFEVTYGTIHFLLIHVYIAILLIILYYSQWLLNYVVHGQVSVKKNI